MALAALVAWGTLFLFENEIIFRLRNQQFGTSARGRVNINNS